MRILALIPARGGSKGIPGKNIKAIAGRPLIDWTIQAACACAHIERVVVSTDDPEIAAVAQQCGADVPFLRPRELARDDTPSMVAVLHALDLLPGYSHLMLLQPTSPLRSMADLEAAIKLAKSASAPSVVSVCEAETHPEWMFSMGEGGHLNRLFTGSKARRRQDLSTVYALNGAIYFVEISWLRRTGTLLTEETLALPMPRERSVDIDDLLDWKFAETLLKEVK